MRARMVVAMDDASDGATGDVANATNAANGAATPGPLDPRRVRAAFVATPVVGLLAWLGLGVVLPAPGERILVLGAPLAALAMAVAGVRPARRDVIKLAALVVLVPLLILGAGSFLASQIGGRLAPVEALVASWFLLSALAIAHGLRALAELLARGVPEARPRLRAAVGGVLTITLGFPFLAASLQAHRIKIGNGAPPAVPHEDVRFRTEDGLEIAAWFFPSRRATVPGPAIVFVHGVSANRRNFLPLADVPRRLGYHVLLFDLRGHGDSEGHSVSFGPHESNDVLAARAWLAARPEVDPDRIVAFGCSLGSAAVVHAASREPDAFAGLLLDSPFADVDRLASSIYWFLPPGVRRVFLELVFLWGRIELEGSDLRTREPQDVAPSVAGPVLLIHGTDDRVIPVEQARILERVLAGRSAEGASVRLEEFDGAIHCGSEDAEPMRYRVLIADFLEEAIGAPGS